LRPNSRAVTDFQKETASSASPIKSGAQHRTKSPAQRMFSDAISSVGDIAAIRRVIAIPMGYILRLAPATVSARFNNVLLFNGA
jgi:hypothetical protein